MDAKIVVTLSGGGIIEHRFSEEEVQNLIELVGRFGWGEALSWGYSDGPVTGKLDKGRQKGAVRAEGLDNRELGHLGGGD